MNSQGSKIWVDQKVLDGLMADLTTAITDLATHHQYWSMRVSMGDGKVRVEYTFSDTPYMIQTRSLVKGR